MQRGTPAPFRKRRTGLTSSISDGHLVPAPIWCSGESHLPNGDILVTGGNLASPGDSGHGQVYTDYAGLPNVFTFDPGRRPGQPSRRSTRVAGGGSATVQTGAGSAPNTAVLMAPGGPTHSIDTGQRSVKLRVSGRRPNRITIQAPATPELAPPGYYMLFVLDAKGVPSQASWVYLQ